MHKVLLKNDKEWKLQSKRKKTNEFYSRKYLTRAQNVHQFLSLHMVHDRHNRLKFQTMEECLPNQFVQQHSWKLPNETQTSPQFMNNVTMPQQMIYCLTSNSTHTTPMYPLLIQLSPVRSCCPHKESHPFWSLYPPNTFLGKHCIECIPVPLKTS